MFCKILTFYTGEISLRELKVMNSFPYDFSPPGNSRLKSAQMEIGYIFESTWK